MKNQDVMVGQVWERKDGRRVKLTAERVFRGSRELEMTEQRAQAPDFRHGVSEPIVG